MKDESGKFGEMTETVNASPVGEVGERSEIGGVSRVSDEYKLIAL